MASFGHPASPKVIKDVTSLIRQNRLQITMSPTYPITPLGHNWISKFKARHLEVRSTWTHAMDGARIDGTAPDVLKKWFTELRTIMDTNQYLSTTSTLEPSPPSQINNASSSSMGMAATSAQNSLASA